MDRLLPPLRDTRLDELFDRWEASYPPELRAGFHRDGALDEVTYYAESVRVVVVQKEPNSSGAKYNKYFGCDLRTVYPRLLQKGNTRHIAGFGKLARTGVAHSGKFDDDDVHDQLRRIAIINLKKLSGSGQAEDVGISLLGWQDRAFLREQIAILQPQLILACGDVPNILLAKVLSDDIYRKPPVEQPWKWNGAKVVTCKHPSLMPYQFPKALEHLARQLMVGE